MHVIKDISNESGVDLSTRYHLLGHEVKAVIFDLDDTLVSSSLDFAAIKAQIGCPPDADILHFIEGLSTQAKQQAMAIVLEHELQDAHSSTCIWGAKEFLLTLSQHNIPHAIVTRNCAHAAQIKLQKHGFNIELVLSREDAPAKPDPSALLQIAEQWQLASEDIAYIGDYIYDVQAAHNADMLAFLFKPLTTKACAEHYLSHLSYIPKKQALKFQFRTVHLYSVELSLTRYNHVEQTMAVITQYVVQHKGVDKLITTDKKEADQYDKMLDIADNLIAYIEAKGISLDEQQAEDLGIMMAKNKDAFAKLLKGNAAEDILDGEKADVVQMAKVNK